MKWDISVTRTGEFTTTLGVREGTRGLVSNSKTRTRRQDSWSSDGKYTREETFTDTFTDEIGIRRDYSYRDDDGQTGGHSTFINDGRGILNAFKDRR